MDNVSVKHILVVDDDDQIRDLICEFMRKSGFVISSACDAKSARQLMALFDFNLAVVDVMMPGEDGISFVKSLRQNGIDLPVLMLTALGEVDDKINGLSCGVDDYLTKPFEPKELILRINNILRRTDKSFFVNNDDNVSFCDFVYNRKTQQLIRADDFVDLTSTEIVLLEYFIDNANKNLSRDDIACCLKLSDNLRGVDVIITRLRKKLESDKCKLISTVRNVGYRFII